MNRLSYSIPQQAHIHPQQQKQVLTVHIVQKNVYFAKTEVIT